MKHIVRGVIGRAHKIVREAYEALAEMSECKLKSSCPAVFLKITWGYKAVPRGIICIRNTCHHYECGFMLVSQEHHRLVVGAVSLASRMSWCAACICVVASCL